MDTERPERIHDRYCQISSVIDFTNAYLDLGQVVEDYQLKELVDKRGMFADQFVYFSFNSSHL
jgi:hypothetical protein